ncbi:MAG: hypothetical protein DSO00_09045 [Archaeoglobi archaeon]|nr:MAG: hypothetical protein DSO00_09045 [Archaeoglobi archaeon]
MSENSSQEYTEEEIDFWNSTYKIARKAFDNIVKHFHFLLEERGKWRREDIFSSADIVLRGERLDTWDSIVKTIPSVPEDKDFSITDIRLGDYVPLETYLFPHVDAETIGSSSAPEDYFVHDYAVAKLKRDNDFAKTVLEAYSIYLKKKGVPADDVLSRVSELDRMNEFNLIDAVAETAAKELISFYFMKEFIEMYFKVEKKGHLKIPSVCETKVIATLYFLGRKDLAEYEIEILKNLSEADYRNITMWNTPCMLLWVPIVAYTSGYSDYEDVTTDEDLERFRTKISLLDRVYKVLPLFAIADNNRRLALFYARLLLHLYRYFCGKKSFSLAGSWGVETFEFSSAVIFSGPEYKSRPPSPSVEEPEKFKEAGMVTYQISEFIEGDDEKRLSYIKRHYPEAGDTWMYFIKLFDSLYSNYVWMGDFVPEEDKIVTEAIYRDEDTPPLENAIFRERIDSKTPEGRKLHLNAAVYYFYKTFQVNIFFRKIGGKWKVVDMEKGRSFLFEPWQITLLLL